MMKGSRGNAYVGFLGGILLALLAIFIGSGIERALSGGAEPHEAQAEH